MPLGSLRSDAELIEYAKEHMPKDGSWLGFNSRAQVVGYALSMLFQEGRPMSMRAILHRWSYHIPRPTFAELSVLFEEYLKNGELRQHPNGFYELVPEDEVHIPLPVSLRFAILKRDDYRCRLCGVSTRDHEDVRLEVDHITPRKKGGTNDPSNLWVLCWDCNRGKGIQDL